MRLDSIYNIGDRVIHIVRTRPYDVVDCEYCSGVGRLTFQENGDEIRCPKCHGTKVMRKILERQWVIDAERSSMTIAKIEIEYRLGEKASKVTYMCTETGCPSGSVYNEEDLFLTFADAVAECDKRNMEEL